jgi:hypothetical protein
MNLSLEKKKKLKKLLESLSTVEEKDELKKIDESKVTEIIQSFKEDEEETEENYNKLLGAFSRHTSSMQKYHQSLMDSFSSLTEGIGKNLEKLGGTITTSYEKNKPFNASGVYKDMINQLSAVKESIEKKPVPVWNWPQYAGVSVRNKNFSNINPAISPFGIDDYDEVALSGYDANNNPSTVTYKLNSQVVAVISLTYDGSGNLTDAHKIQ